MLISCSVIKSSNVQFGTSGARGLVSQFKSNTCAAFTHAFIASIKHRFSFMQVAVAIDNRPSSPAMAQAVIQAIIDSGLEPIYYGVIPTPALAYAAMQDDIPCIMITGSHIPFDRNGIKFYRPDGEISKSDEQEILSIRVKFESIKYLPALVVNPKAAEKYLERYITPFPRDLFVDKKIGIYEHSSAGRDIYSKLFTSLGAEVIALERSDEFVPIDTEAVSEADKIKALNWAAKYHFDMIFSTDGDGDRPLVADEKGQWLRGDLLGLLCADAIKIESLAVPVSCNTIIEGCYKFKFVKRTKIGSPYVIAEFDNLLKDYASVAGFEANGGFLLGSDIKVNNIELKALPTRDAVLPAIMLLKAAGHKGISSLVDKLPQRYTYSDRIQNFSTEKSKKIISVATKESTVFLSKLGLTDIAVESINTTDGLRLILSNDDIIHLRPSGNAPELRCYAESSNEDVAIRLVKQVLSKVQEF